MVCSVVNMTRIETLNEENYDTWCMRTEVLPSKNDLWVYVNGKTKRSEIIQGNSAIETATRERDEMIERLSQSLFHQ